MSEAPGRVAMWPPPSEGFEGSFAKFTCRFVRSCHALVNLSRAKSKIFVVPAGGEPKRLHLRFPNLVKLDSALRIGEGVSEVPNRDDDAFYARAIGAPNASIKMKIQTFGLSVPLSSIQVALACGATLLRLLARFREHACMRHDANFYLQRFFGLCCINRCSRLPRRR